MNFEIHYDPCDGWAASDLGDDHVERQIKSMEAEVIADMFKPVRCACGQVYDIGKVTVNAQHADCSMWKAPCCGRQADDRGETGWKSTQDYTVIDKADPYPADIFGRW